MGPVKRRYIAPSGHQRGRAVANMVREAVGRGRILLL